MKDAEYKENRKIATAPAFRHLKTPPCKILQGGVFSAPDMARLAQIQQTAYSRRLKGRP